MQHNVTPNPFHREMAPVVWAMFFAMALILAAALIAFSVWIPSALPAAGSSATQTAAQATAVYGAEQFYIQLTAQAQQIGGRP